MKKYQLDINELAVSASFFMFLAFLLSSKSAICQKENNNWLFGYGAGLNFNGPSPTILANGQTQTREGVASISDKNTGALLFYSDGTKVWNANHQLMPNGNGLLGDYSSTQSALIVPYPNHDGQYFLFTDDYHGGPNGYRYSVVDMSLNGGLGDVLPGSKNILIYIGNCEKMIAVQHCNGRDYWLITHEGLSNKFYVHLISENGIGPGQIFAKGLVFGNNWQNVGYLKVSPNGLVLANAIGPNSNYLESRVELFSFDPATGAIDGPTVELTGMQFAYGAEFSGDSKLLYISELQTFGVSSSMGLVHQYNLQAGNSAAVQASDVVLKADNSVAFGAIQRASDGRIYVSMEFGYNTQYGYLDRIEYPEILGIGCTYTEDAIGLGAGGTLIGLPTFLQNAGFNAIDFTFDIQTSCTDHAVQFQVENGANLDSVQWFFGDATGMAVQSTEFDPLHDYGQSGQYTVSLVTYSPCSIDTLTDTISIAEQSSSATISLPVCPGATVVYGGMTLSPGDVQTFIFNNWLNCDSVVTVTVIGTQPDTTQLALYLCNSETSLVYNGQQLVAGDQYTWVGTNQLGCDSVVFVNVSASALVSFDLSAPQTCWNASDGSIAVGNIAGSTPPYQFSLDGTNYQPDSLFTGLLPSNYTVFVQDQSNCVFEENIAIPTIPPIIAIAGDEALTCGETLLLSPYVESELPLIWEWHDSTGLISSSPEVLVSLPGIYSFTVNNSCESLTKTITVGLTPSLIADSIYLPNAVSPNDDGFNDCFRGFVGPNLNIVAYELKIFDRWGELLFETADIEGCWDGHFRGKTMNPAVMVYWMKLRVRACDGQEETIFKKGDISLIR